MYFWNINLCYFTSTQWILFSISYKAESGRNELLQLFFVQESLYQLFVSEGYLYWVWNSWLRVIFFQNFWEFSLFCVQNKRFNFTFYNIENHSPQASLSEYFLNDLKYDICQMPSSYLCVNLFWVLYSISLSYVSVSPLILHSLSYCNYIISLETR